MLGSLELNLSNHIQLLDVSNKRGFLNSNNVYFFNSEEDTIKIETVQVH